MCDFCYYPINDLLSPYPLPNEKQGCGISSQGVKIDGKSTSAKSQQSRGNLGQPCCTCSLLNLRIQPAEPQETTPIIFKSRIQLILQYFQYFISLFNKYSRTVGLKIPFFVNLLQ